MEGILKQVGPKLYVDQNKLLGRGSTGDVYEGVFLSPSPQPVAVKIIPLSEINNEVTAYLLQCEIEALKAVSKTQNNHVLQLKEIVVTDGNCHIATELLCGGTLKELIAKNKILELSLSMRLLKQILVGYSSLIENKIIHRDLKPDNILMSKDQEPKIIDFGYCIAESVQKKPNMYYNVGSPRYMSPEAYKNNEYSEKSDIWSIGIIFYEMLTGTTFDVGKDISDTFENIKNEGIPIPSFINSQCRSILQNMLLLDPESRYTCKQLFEQLTEQPVRKPRFLFHSPIERTQSPKNTSINFISTLHAPSSPYRLIGRFPQNEVSLKKANELNTTLNYKRPTINFNMSPERTILKANFNETSMSNRVRPNIVIHKHLPNVKNDLSASLNLSGYQNEEKYNRNSFHEASYQNLRVSINFGDKHILKDLKMPLRQSLILQKSPLSHTPLNKYESPKKQFYENSPLLMSKVLLSPNRHMFNRESTFFMNENRLSRSPTIFLNSEKNIKSLAYGMRKNEVNIQPVSPFSLNPFILK